jgi:hypothetical protein
MAKSVLYQYNQLNQLLNFRASLLRSATKRLEFSSGNSEISCAIVTWSEVHKLKSFGDSSTAIRKFKSKAVPTS